MADFHKVSKVFQATDKDTKEPIVDGYGNTKWMFQVEGQTAEGWMSLQRKAGSELKEGDHVYGIIDTWPGGNKAKFVRQNPPEGVEYPKSASTPTQAPTTQSTPQLGGSQSELSQVLAIVKRLEAHFLGGTAGAPANNTKDIVLEDIDDKPVDLSSIDY